MKPDDFEQRLRRQPLKEIPAGWREEILSAAERTSHPAPRASLLSTLNSQLSAILWPHPAAWAGLAVVWVLVFAVNFSTRDQSPVMAEKSAPPSPEVVVELKQQQRLLAELMGPRDVDRSKPLAPRPRTERIEVLMT